MASVEIAGRPIRGTEVAHMLGRTPEYVSKCRKAGVSDEADKITRLAMAAISAGLKPWGDK